MLDFLGACIKSPKIWQGRDKKLPKVCFQYFLGFQCTFEGFMAHEKSFLVATPKRVSGGMLMSIQGVIYCFPQLLNCELPHHE